MKIKWFFFLEMFESWACLISKPLHQICVWVWAVQSRASLSDSQFLRMWASSLIGHLIKTSTCLQLLNLPSKQVFPVYSPFHVVCCLCLRHHFVAILFLSLPLSTSLSGCLFSHWLLPKVCIAFHLYMAVCIGCPPQKQVGVGIRGKKNTKSHPHSAAHKCPCMSLHMCVLLC